ncbi:MAG: hypothetical protein WCY19_07945 [Candidatus Gastranaerophilaceae bacterium]
MVDGVVGAPIASNVEVPQKKKSGVGKTILGTTAAAVVGGTAGYFASNKMFDSFIKEAEAAIAHPDAIKAKLLKVTDANLLPEDMIEETVKRTIKLNEESLLKLKSLKNKWIAAAAIVGGALYLGCKAIFGKKNKAEKV